MAKRRKRSSGNVEEVTTTTEKVVPVKVVPEEVTTTTRVKTVPTVEVRKPATLAQALTERAEIVNKPKTEVIERKIVKRRRA